MTEKQAAARIHKLERRLEGISADRKGAIRLLRRATRLLERGLELRADNWDDYGDLRRYYDAVEAFLGGRR